MGKWEVPITYTAIGSVTVEAETADEARERASEHAEFLARFDLLEWEIGTPAPSNNVEPLDRARQAP